MKLLIKNATIVDTLSPQNGQCMDILIESGMIHKIATSIEVNVDKIITGNGLHVSAGWVDPFVQFPDPGFEFKETIASGMAAAAAGGFTDVFVLPNNHPVTDGKSQVEYIKNKSLLSGVTIHPIGAISKGAEGKDLAEMYDMHASGAIAFSDGMLPVQSAGVLLKALQYVKAFDGIIIQIPDDTSIGKHGLMHEGIVSTQIGLAGKPMLAEELLVARDISLAKYTASKIHFTGVTSPLVLDMIRQAKKEGVQVTCSVTPYHLYFIDESLRNYDTHLKVYPPIRTYNEQLHLREAILDGTIDCVSSHHQPQDIDHKIVEFEQAGFGMIGLETIYAVLKTAMPEVSDSRWIELLSTNPRSIFGLELAPIIEGNTAHITLFEPETSITFDKSMLHSKSHNTPFLGIPLKGKVRGIIAKNFIHLPR